jgi:molybdopterin converting factor small subunit
MSKTQDKRKQRRIEHAEFMWKQAQLRAAFAKTELDLAIQTFKDAMGELTEEQVKETEEKAQEQYKRIEDFLMKEKEQYLERLGIQQD